MKKAVGIFRVLSLENLDETARLLKKYSPSDVYDILNDRLKEKAQGAEGRRKLINNLMKIWGNGKSKPFNYQIEAIEIYDSLSSEEQKAMHYLLALIAFPFLAYEAKLAGRYLMIMDTITSKTFMNEMINAYGNSGTITRSVSNGFGMLREFGFIDQVKPGVYSLGREQIIVNSPILKKYIVLAALANANGDTLTLEAINADKTFFGLDFTIHSRDLQSHTFEIVVERTQTYVKLI